MCRLVAYLGPPVTLEELLIRPDRALSVQAWDPHEQSSGTVNADGFGVGWFDRSRRPEPAVHKSARSMWADRSFASFAGVVASTSVVSVARGATAPSPIEDSGAQPFSVGRWLFAHNGAVEGFRDGVASRLRRRLSGTRESAILGASDSEVLFALALDQLDAGEDPGAALSAVVSAVDDQQGGRLNLVLTDGEVVAATRWGDSLYQRVDPAGGSITIASEPFGTPASWTPVPDRSLVMARAGSVDSTVDLPSTS